MSQGLTVQLLNAVATNLLTRENATVLNQSKWFSNIPHAAPVAESQSLTVLSLDADATSLLSGENATELNAPE